MREFVRSIAAALSIAGLAAAIAIASAGDALAQATQAPPKQTVPVQTAPPPAVKQMALTEKQIEGVLAAQSRTVLPATTNTTTSSTTSASCSRASIRRPSNMSALMP